MPEDSFTILADHKVLSKAKSRLDFFIIGVPNCLKPGQLHCESPKQLK